MNLLEKNIKNIFPTTNYIEESASYQDREIVFRLYKHILYVEKPVDEDFQSMDIYVPISVNGIRVEISEAPILLMNKVFGYQAYRNKGEQASWEKEFAMHTEVREVITEGITRNKKIKPGQEGYEAVRDEETKLHALSQGLVVVIPGTRGVKNQTKDGRYYGKAPATIVDLKAVVRYLKYNKKIVPGNVDLIISRGVSAGGAMSALLGTSGNNPLYENYLEDIGAAKGEDDVFACISMSPILDLEHQDSAYEWEFGELPTYDRAKDTYLPVKDSNISHQLKMEFKEYIDILNLKGDDEYGFLNSENIDNYILEKYLLPSAEKYISELNECDRQIYLSNHPWIEYENNHCYFEFRNYVAYNGRIKGMPAFDRADLTKETEIFGNETVNARHFTNFSLRQETGNKQISIPEEIINLRNLMNPMNFILKEKKCSTKYWWIRQGAKECGSSVHLVVNIATALKNIGCCVNFKTVWDGGHCAEDDQKEMFEWIHAITGYNFL